MCVELGSLFSLHPRHPCLLSGPGSQGTLKTTLLRLWTQGAHGQRGDISQTMAFRARQLILHSIPHPLFPHLYTDARCIGKSLMWS